MKHLSLKSLTPSAALFLATVTVAVAQPAWQTVDALTPWRGRAIVADSAGNFVSLAIDDSNSGTGSVSTAVSLSSDTGLTWQSVGSIPGYALKLTAAGPDGTLYASGNRSATVSGKAFIWSSADHGTTWAVSDPWAGQTSTFLCLDIAAGNSGSIYACGYVTGTYTGGRWIVRKGQPSPNGITWATVDSFAGSQPQSISVSPGTPGQPDNILVCGLGNGTWTVRQSPNGGATWTTIDNYAVTMPPGNPTAVTSALDSSIYVIGRITKTVNKATQYGWLVRKSSNGGASWANVDYFVNGWPASGTSLTVDAFGRVFAVGFLSTSNYTWVVRGSTDGGATWTTTDSFLPPGYMSAQAMGAASDAFGNLCVEGDVENGTPSADVAPIRRLASH